MQIQRRTLPAIVAPSHESLASPPGCQGFGRAREASDTALLLAHGQGEARSEICPTLHQSGHRCAQSESVAFRSAQAHQGVAGD